MKVENKSFEFKIDDASETDGIIRGYASTFGNIDLGDDVVDAGAFKKTLKENKGRFPILDSHDPTKQIGWNLKAEETKDGLFVEGQILMESQLGKEKFLLAKKAVEIGAKMGLSIGYSVIKAEPDRDRPSVRRLKEVKLYEYSIVTFPMNTAAMVTDAKNWNPNCSSAKELVVSFTEYAKNLGYEPSEISNALQYGAAKLKSIDPVRVGQSIDKLMDLLKQQ